MTRIVAGMLACILAGPVAGGYKAGVAVKVITPAEPMWMAGYASRTKPADGKTHDLYAKALALADDAGGKLLLVTTDLIGLPKALADDVAKEIAAKTGLTRGQIMLTASHTHCGPVVRDNLADMYDMPPAERAKVDAYAKQLRAWLVEIAVAAVADLKPADLSHGTGTCGFAVNRRQITAKVVGIGVNPAGPVDHSVPVLLVSRGGKPAAVAFGYACHNTTLAFQQWCGDYAGFAQADIEAKYPGAVALFWTGCGADANPEPRRELAHAKKYGADLAAAVAAVIDGKTAPITGRLTAAFAHVSLPFDMLPTREQLTADLLSKSFAHRTRAARLMAILDAGKPIPPAYPEYPVQAWAVGDQVLWLALGGEVVVDFAVRLKKEVPAGRAAWIAAYANDVMAYIPSRRVWAEGGYEADSSQVYYGLPGRWKPDVEELIVPKALDLAKAVTPVPGPKTPADERATFQHDPAIQIELAAAEPAVVDPVAACFDERGRLYVCEMRGYPNGGVGTGTESRGRVKCLTDRDGDGVYETAAVFADGLRFPMGVCPWKGGVLVAVAPDIVYLEDTDGDGRADKTTVLYTGFNLKNIQQMVNGLQWGWDGWVYGLAGSDGGTVTCPAVPNMKPLPLGSRGFRFRPGEPGNIEPVSGGGQYGLTADPFGHWFTNTNSQHLRQVAVADHYLRRNPAAVVPAVTVDIPDHGAACRVFRISPFEAWRLERTTRRSAGGDAARFAATELIPGGYMTSGCSPLVFAADGLPLAYHGNVFVCDPANNLIHRDVLEKNGPLFVARRGDADREFLASTDNWFRPVHLSIGPDAALYVCDFYREAIETPLSLPDDIKAKMNLESRDRGRIWRVIAAGKPRPAAPTFRRDDPHDLSSKLLDANPWVRLTAKRLILERPPAGVAEAILRQVPAAAGTPALPVVLGTLAVLGRLPDSAIGLATLDPLPGNREVALKLGESRLATSTKLRPRVVELAGDPDAMVRYQLAFSAAFLPDAERAKVLAAVMARDGSDPWIAAAVLCSAGKDVVPLVAALAAADVAEAVRPVLTRAAAAAAGQGADAVAAVLKPLGRSPATDWAILEGLGQGLRGRSSALAEHPAAMERFRAAAAALAADDGADQLAAARVLAFAPYDIAAGPLAAKFTPQTPPDVQAAAVRSLAAHASPDVVGKLVAAWKAAGPAVRREIQEQMFARPDRTRALLDAIEAGTVRAAEIDPVRVALLKKSPVAAVKARAEKLFPVGGAGDRKAALDSFQTVFHLPADATRGKAVFLAQCAACHKLGTDGHAVGPDLVAVVGGKSTADLLTAVLDPNREVDSRYVAYQLNAADGRTLTGVIAADSPNAVTLRRADGAEDTIRRADIESLRSTGLSLMPEGMEKQVTPQQVADLFAYVRQQAGKK